MIDSACDSSQYCPDRRRLYHYSSLASIVAVIDGAADSATQVACTLLPTTVSFKHATSASGSSDGREMTVSGS